MTLPGPYITNHHPFSWKSHPQQPHKMLQDSSIWSFVVSWDLVLNAGSTLDDVVQPQIPRTQRQWLMVRAVSGPRFFPLLDAPLWKTERLSAREMNTRPVGRVSTINICIIQGECLSLRDSLLLWCRVVTAVVDDNCCSGTQASLSLSHSPFGHPKRGPIEWGTRDIYRDLTITCTTSHRGSHWLENVFVLASICLGLDSGEEEANTRRSIAWTWQSEGVFWLLMAQTYLTETTNYIQLHKIQCILHD